VTTRTQLNRTDRLVLGDYEISVEDLLSLVEEAGHAVQPEIGMRSIPAESPDRPKTRMVRCDCGSIRSAANRVPRAEHETVDPLGGRTPHSMESMTTGQKLRELLLEEPDRRFVMIFSVIAGLIFIMLLTLILPPDSRIAAILLDRRSPHFPYPFTIQNIEHIMLFLGSANSMFVGARLP